MTCLLEQSDGLGVPALQKGDHARGSELLGSVLRVDALHLAELVLRAVQHPQVIERGRTEIPGEVERGIELERLGGLLEREPPIEVPLAGDGGPGQVCLRELRIQLERARRLPFRALAPAA